MYLGSQKNIFGAVSTRGKLNPHVPQPISLTNRPSRKRGVNIGNMDLSYQNAWPKHIKCHMYIVACQAIHVYSIFTSSLVIPESKCSSHYILWLASPPTSWNYVRQTINFSFFKLFFPLTPVGREFLFLLPLPPDMQDKPLSKSDIRRIKCELPN